MDKELFESGADVDVEALMARIREVVVRPKGSIPQYDPKPLQSSNLQSIRVENLIHEIQHSFALAQIVNQIPLKETGFRRSLEHSAKKFLKWLVHWNTKGQADFNISVARSLELIAQQLQNSQTSFVAVREQASRLLAELKRIGQIAEAIGLEYSGLEQNVSQAVEEVRTKAKALVVDLCELERKTDEKLNKIGQRTQTDLASMGERLQEVERDARAGHQESMKQMSALDETVSCRVDDLNVRLLRAERALKTAFERNGSLSLGANEGQRIASKEQRIDQKETGQRRSGATSPRDSALEWRFDYFLFESTFRGSISEIKCRQSLYVEPFLGKKNVVDLGCGRGEFVELLSENGINVTGVDINEDMVEFCRGRELRVVHADIFDYLASLPEKVDGIFLSQVVEHLAPGEILELVDLCAQKLEAGGVIVAETVNTNCPAALSNFYLDPTHVRPVPAEMLRFVFEQASFEVQYLRFSSPVNGNDVSQVLDLRSRLTQEAILYQDYAVVAVAR